MGEGQSDGVVAGTDQGLSMIKAGGLDFDKRLARLQRGQFLLANLNDLGAARPESASDATPIGGSH
jgi:hypothetical protein